MFVSRLACHALLTALIANGAYASFALAQAVPSSADPVNAAERFKADPFARPDEDLFAREKPQEKKPETESGKFILGGVIFKGMTVYQPEAFTDITSKLIGMRVGKDEVDAIAAAVTERYQIDGYALAVAFLPSQSLIDGSTLIVQVEEGRIGEISFQGERPPASVHEFLDRHIEKMRSEIPVKSETLEHYLLLINDLPGNTARAVLRPSTRDPGATDLAIYYTHKPYDIVASTDNRGSRFLGPWQHTLSAAANSSLGMDERLSLRTITTSPTDELRYIDAQYLQPLNAKGTKLQVMGSYAKTVPGESLKAQNINSESSYLQVKAIHPFLRSRTKNLYARVSGDMRNTISDSGSTNIADDRLRNIRIGGSFDRSSDQSATIIDTELSKGINGLGATEDGLGRSVRTGNHGYTKLTLDVSHSHALIDEFSVLVSGSGQYALDSLLSSEQFILGGPVYGTAYDPGELSGDHGAAGKIELRYGSSLRDAMVNSYQLYSFYDVGTVWRKKPTGSNTSRDSLASAGTGVRVEFSNNISGNLELALPLTRDLGSDRDNDGRIFGGLSIRR